MNMECSICGSANLVHKKYDCHVKKVKLLDKTKAMVGELWFIIPKNFPMIRQKFIKHKKIFKGDILVCSDCGYGKMKRPPSQKQIKEFYRNRYWEGRNLNTEIVTESQKYLSDPRAKYQMSFVQNSIDIKRIKSVLEIGAGGSYLSLLLRKKCKDINLNVCEPGKMWKEYYKKNNINKVAEYFPFNSNETYDYIHTSHWLEHTLDLEDTLLNLNKICKKGGYLFIEVPNTEYYYWDLQLPDIPHIHFFTTKSLRKLLKKYGFECLDIKECGISYKEQAEGTILSENRYGECKKGFYIRSLFRKI